LEKAYEDFMSDFALLVGADNINAILSCWPFWPSWQVSGVCQLALLNNVSRCCSEAM